MYLENLPFTICNVGLSFKKADQTIRGKFNIDVNNQQLLLEEAKSMGIPAMMVLSTCNRTEVTAFTNQIEKIIHLIVKYSSGTVEEFNKVCTIYKNYEVVDHLFKLGTGLASQILGDYEIVGQLKNAFQTAKNAGATNHYLERLMNGVLQANKESKNNTKLCSGVTSTSYTAVQFIKHDFKDFENKKILLYGLGDIGKNTCKNILQYTSNKNICVINRTHQKAIEFKQKHPSIRVSSEAELKDEVKQSDILIVSTAASSPTITKEHFTDKNYKLVLDLSIPSNVSNKVNELENVKLIGLDELSKKTANTFEIRGKEISKVQEIIEKHKKFYDEWIRHRKLIPALHELKANLEAIKQDELIYQSKNIKNFNHQQAEIITSRMIHKLSSKYIKHLRSDDIVAAESINTIRKIFNNDHLTND